VNTVSSPPVVLELATAIAGPLGPRFLADLGARVIKVERPEEGDPMRTYSPPGFAAGASFDYTGAGEESLAIDIAHPRGQELVRRLAEHVDVVVANFTPGTLEKLGLDYETLRERKPDLVMCAVSGFGQTGPWRPVRAVDPVVQGEGGVIAMIGDPGAKPYMNRTAPVDSITATQSALAVMAALFHRDRTGEGQFIDVTLMESAAAMDALILPSTLNGATPARRGNVHPLGTSVTVIGKDRAFVVDLAVREGVSGYHAASEIVGWDSGTSVLDAPEDFTAALETWWSARRSDEEALELLGTAGILVAPVLTPVEVAASDQALARGVIRKRDSDSGDPVMVQAAPYRFSRSETRVGRAPRLGEHTDAVLEELLGVTTSERAELRSLGILG
jgi:crotonobetainyl-CoA:carnitine CoA-transferase CaiB-like acyl-CoA transferase